MHTPLLNQKIKHFYDQSTRLWLDTWGEHMHHGYYGLDGNAQKNHQKAQEDLILELLSWGDVNAATRILDAGCGVGGSARYLAKKFDAKATGITLSPVQANAGNALSDQAGLSGKVNIQVHDMMAIEHETGSQFDLVWSLESAEHIASKKAMFEKFYSVCSPGGKVLVATWCHRNKPPELDGTESKLLEAIGQIYNLPPLCSENELKHFAVAAGFSEVATSDWSTAVAPFWKAVIRSALRWRTLWRLLTTGWSTIRGAWAMRYMQKGFKKGVIRFVVLKATKPPHTQN